MRLFSRRSVRSLTQRLRLMLVQARPLELTGAWWQASGGQTEREVRGRRPGAARRPQKWSEPEPGARRGRRRHRANAARKPAKHEEGRPKGKPARAIFPIYGIIAGVAIQPKTRDHRNPKRGGRRTDEGEPRARFGKRYVAKTTRAHEPPPLRANHGQCRDQRERGGGGPPRYVALLLYWMRSWDALASERELRICRVVYYFGCPCWRVQLMTAPADVPIISCSMVKR